MKTILVFVISLDGKITKWGNPYVKKWSSKTDQDYFERILNDTQLVIMGSNTYNPDPIKPSSNRNLVIMTQNAADYKSLEIPGQLEYTNEIPSRLVERFEKEGLKEMLIVGGAHVATSFLREQLIDEIWLTIEPKIFGQGGNFVIEEKLDIDLQLITCERANEQGTLITKYAVIKDKILTPGAK